MTGMAGEQVAQEELGADWLDQLVPADDDPRPDDLPLEVPLSRAELAFEKRMAAPNPRDWLGFETMEAMGVERIYGLKSVRTDLDLPETVRLKRELMGWIPEIPVKEIRVHVLPKDLDGAWPEVECCSDRNLVKNGRRDVRIRDRRIHNTPTVLVIGRQRYECTSCGSSVSEDLPEVYWPYRITRRLHRDIALGSVKRPFADAAALQSVDNKLVRRIFHDYQKLMLADYQVNLPAVVGVDEIKICGHVCLVVSDLTNGRILDIRRGNTKRVVVDFFQTHSYRFNVKVLCQDMSTTYKDAAAEAFADSLPKPLVVVDRFHVIQQATKAMDKARIAFADTLPRKNKAALGRNRFLFNKHRRTLTPANQELLKDLKGGSDKLALAHKLKEQFERIYEKRTRAEAEAAFDAWVEVLNAPANRPVSRHFRGLERMVRTWSTEIFNFFDTEKRGIDRGVTNAFVEGLNSRLRLMNRNAHGLTLATLRAKAILRFGHFHTMEELANMSIDVSATEDEVLEALNFRIWKGFDLDALNDALAAGTF